MLTDSYPENQDQSYFPPLSLSFLVTPVTYSKSFKFINGSPPIDESLSRYFSDLLEKHDKQQREKAKQSSGYQQKYGPKNRQTKAENRHRMMYTLSLFNIAYIKSEPSRATVSRIVGCHRNTFDNHKREMQKMHFLDWKSGKPTYETNIYYLPEHVSNQHIPRPKDFTIPWWLWKAIEKVLKRLNWNDKQVFYLQFLKDIVHHIPFGYGKVRTSLDENEKKSSKDPPKTRAGPRKTIFWQLLEPFNFNFRDQAILSSYGEATLRAAISDLESYYGKVSSPIAFLISRCKALKSKCSEMVKELHASAEENLAWLKEYFSDEEFKSKCHGIKSAEEIDRSTKSKKPYVRCMVHRTIPEKSKLIIEQKVYGHWIETIIEVTRKRFRTAVIETFEMAFKTAFKQDNAEFS